jgi:RNA recognition motif-containing protein
MYIHPLLTTGSRAGGQLRRIMNGKPRLLISDVPVNCSEHQVAQWIEGNGYDVENIVLIRDMVSGTSPSFAQVRLKDSQLLDHAVRALSGQLLYGRTIHVCRLDTRSVVPQTGKHKDVRKASVP